jgi:aminocarboxymuconate-semialdehyde decarboxylase
MVIDFHTHYLAYEHLQMHVKTPEGRVLGASLHGEGKNAILEANGVPMGSACNPEEFYNLPLRLELMEKSGVDMQVISPPPFMTFAEIEGTRAARLAREQNEAIAAVVQQYPTSFRGLAIAPWQDTDSAIKEIAYALDTLGLAGVEMVTQIAGKNLDHPSLDAIWQALDARNAVVLLHPYQVLGAERLTHYYLWNLLGNPVETALALACLAFGGVFERFPHIRFIAAHGGGVAPFVIGRWERAAVVRPELVHLRSSPLELLRYSYADTIVHGPQELLYLVEMLGAERVVLGTDFPFDMGTTEPVALFGAPLDNDVRQRILTGHQSLLER